MTYLPTRQIVAGIVTAAVLGGGMACREHDPPTILAADLGNGARLLTPRAMRSHDLTILNARAAPVMAEDIDLTAVAADRAAEGALAESAGTPVSEADIAMLVELVDYAVEALAGKNLADFVDLFPESQHEAARTLGKSLEGLTDSSLALLQELRFSAPDALAMLSPTLADLPAEGDITPKQVAGMLKLSNLTMTARDRAAGTLTLVIMPIPVAFQLIDDYWYFDGARLLDNAEAVNAFADATDLLVEKLDDLLIRAGGDLTPEQLGPALMQIGPEVADEFQAVAAALGIDETANVDADNAGDADDDADGGDTDAVADEAADAPTDDSADGDE